MVRTGSRVSSESVMTSSKPMNAKNTSAAPESTPPAPPGPESRSTSPTCDHPATMTSSSPPTWTRLRRTVIRAERLMPEMATAVTDAISRTAPVLLSTSTKYSRYRAKPSDTAAAATNNPTTIIHPVTKATDGGATCRAYSYSAPARGNMAASSM